MFDSTVTEPVVVFRIYTFVAFKYDSISELKMVVLNEFIFSSIMNSTDNVYGCGNGDCAGDGTKSSGGDGTKSSGGDDVKGDGDADVEGIRPTANPVTTPPTINKEPIVHAII